MNYKINHFINHIKATVSIEIAFVLANILILLFGILELSLMYSIRSGLETIAQEISRDSLSTSGGDFLTALSADPSLDRNQYFTDLIHQKIVNIISKPEDIELCVLTLVDLNASAPLTNECVQFSPDAATRPTTVNFGNSDDFIKIYINYTHEYLTPLGSLIGTLSNTTIQILSISRRE
jgi:hypothetical protein